MSRLTPKTILGVQDPRVCCRSPTSPVLLERMRRCHSAEMGGAARNPVDFGLSPP
jgi:hypothetical protein